MYQLRVIGLAACLVSTPVLALEKGESRVNGFGTVGFSHLGGEDKGRGFGVYGQTKDGWRGDQLSKFGGQVQYGVTDAVGLTVQATAKAYGNEWKPTIEWAYLSWQANDELMVRTGRLRTPVYQYSESLDVGYSYPWLRLPDEVYSLIQASNYEGVDAIYTVPLSFATLSLQGAVGVAKNRDYYLYDTKFDIDYSNLAGANVTLATNDYGSVRLGYIAARIDTDIAGNYIDITGKPGRSSLMKLDGDHAKFTSLSYQYDNGTWLTSSEMARRVIESDGSHSSDAFYIMGGRRFGDFLAHLTYAQVDDNPGRQRSWAAGLNYSVSPTVVIKTEFKRVDTTNAYDGNFVRNAQELYNQTIYARTGGSAGKAPRRFDADIISIGVDFVF